MLEKAQGVAIRISGSPEEVEDAVSLLKSICSGCTIERDASNGQNRRLYLTACLPSGTRTEEGDSVVVKRTLLAFVADILAGFKDTSSILLASFVQHASIDSDTDVTTSRLLSLAQALLTSAVSNLNAFLNSSDADCFVIKPAGLPVVDNEMRHEQFNPLD